MTIINSSMYNVPTFIMVFYHLFESNHAVFDKDCIASTGIVVIPSAISP